METLAVFENSSLAKKCLNRTMQYGNKSVDDSTQVGCEFKSYYVVWKLFFSMMSKLQP